MSNPTSPSRMVYAGAALAAIALTGGWTLAGKLFQTVQPEIVTASLGPDSGVSVSSFAERFNQRVARVEPNATFADRFEPARRAPLAGSAPVAVPTAEPARQVAWFAPASMGAPPDHFTRSASIADEPTVPAPAAKEQEVALMQPAPTVQQLVASIPMPAARPADADAAQDSPPSQVAQAAPKPKGGAYGHDALVQRARMALLAQPKTAKLNVFEKLFGGSAPQHGPMLAYAGSDGGVLSNGQDAAAAGQPSDIDRQTAVYDISAKRVYMPDGTKLEAHSGLGSRLDNPASANERMRGVTPPHIYDLKPREALFHGVAALRLTPLGGEGAIYGRNGLLAHTYMLGPNGDSNGCISFRDYNKFLQAYRRGEVKRIVVVGRLS